MVETLISWIESLSHVFPLPLFVIFGSFLEELIAPIPSPLVMTSAGTLIQTNNQTAHFILYIAIIAAVSKTLASVILYVVSDKMEDVLISKFGKLLQISHKDTESIGKHFNNTRRDDLVLFILRALPLFPSAPISVLCGIIKINMKTYIGATFAGSVVKNIIYLYTGILSVNYLESLKDGYDTIENIGYFILLLITAFVVLQYRKKRSL